MRKQLIAAVAITALAACSSIDCPLNNRVYAVYRFEGTADATGTLTVRTPRTQAEGDDSTVVNNSEYTDSIVLPMSYGRSEDVFYFDFDGLDTGTTSDTVWVSKENHPHFESPDCNPTFFHTIQEVRHTQHVIESITINNNRVTYDTNNAHFIVRLKNSSGAVADNR